MFMRSQFLLEWYELNLLFPFLDCLSFFNLFLIHDFIVLMLECVLVLDFYSVSFFDYVVLGITIMPCVLTRKAESIQLLFSTSTLLQGAMH